MDSNQAVKLLTHDKVNEWDKVKLDFCFLGHFVRIKKIKRSDKLKSPQIELSCRPHCCKRPEGISISMSLDDFDEAIFFEVLT